MSYSVILIFRGRFELITAFLWKSRTKALKLDEHNEDVSLVIAMNFRGKRFPELPPNINININGYYGNAIVSPAAVTKAKTLCNSPLIYAIELLKKTKGKVNHDYVKSAVDFMALHGKPRFGRKDSWIVSDISRIGYREVDFGWGKPIHAAMEGGLFSTMSPYNYSRNIQGEEGLLVPIGLPVSAMDRFKEEIGKVITHLPFQEPKNLRTLPSML